MKIKQYHTV